MALETLETPTSLSPIDREVERFEGHQLCRGGTLRQSLCRNGGFVRKADLGTFSGQTRMTDFVRFPDCAHSAKVGDDGCRTLEIYYLLTVFGNNEHQRGVIVHENA